MIANIVIPPAARPGIAAPDGLDLVAHPHKRVTKQALYHSTGRIGRHENTPGRPELRRRKAGSQAGHTGNPARVARPGGV
ncbi:hypothetical protein GCM10008937_20980 [Deinococcus depolymerans]|uniref:Transposase n=1 Tax=Deinococcus depolymerans TaxID=392408 RepID=A0ABP3M4A0_9DEIO